MKKQASQFKGKWPLAALLILLCAVVFTGVWALKRQTAAAPRKAPPVDPAASLAEVTLDGRIQARTAVAVPAPIEGKIDFFHVEVGQEVSEGQLIALIKSEASEAHQQAAQLEFDQAQSRLNNLESAISAARLEASRARAEALRAKSELDRAGKTNTRQKMLLSAGATPRLVAEKAQQDYDKSVTESKTLSEAATQAEDRVAGMLREQEALRKTLAEKTESLEQARAEVAAGEVRSPVDGIVTARKGSLGDQVDRTLTDLFQIATGLSALDIVVEPAPNILARIKQGQQATVRVAELSGEALPGVVRKVENGQAVIEFTSPLPEIKPGLTAQVTIKLT